MFPFYIVTRWDDDKKCKCRLSRNVWETTRYAKEERAQLEIGLTESQRRELRLHVEYFTDEKDWSHTGEWIGKHPYEDYDEEEEIAAAYNYGMD